MNSLFKSVSKNLVGLVGRIQSNYFPVVQHPRFVPEFQLLGPSISDDADDLKIPTVYDSILLMGVPKSKVSPSRKRQKHLQHVPDKIDWHVCSRCGEPKRPHRICTKHMDICAMRDEDWQALETAKSAAKEKTAADSSA